VYFLNVVLSESKLITRRIGSLRRDSKVCLFIAVLISLVRSPSHCSTCTEGAFVAGVDAICGFHSPWRTGMWYTSSNVPFQIVDALRNSVTNSKTKIDQGSPFSFRPRLELAIDAVVYAQ
jgi:hypothetical protein